MKVFFVSAVLAIISLFCADNCAQLNKVDDGKAKNLYVDVRHLVAGTYIRQVKPFN